jgi:hypothetical protein
VIVDNASTDSTLAAALDVQLQSPAGSVHVVSEAEIGYVPARERGVRLVTELCRRDGREGDDALLVQVDADATYSRGYLEAIASAAEVAGPNTLLEARSQSRESLAGPLDSLAWRVDSMALPFTQAGSRYDCVVDDKRCAMRLGDLQRWGGYARDFDRFGDELYAETTRLLMRAAGHGAQRLTVEGAGVRHMRRVPPIRSTLEFAAAGFPLPKKRATDLAQYLEQAVGADVDGGVSVLEAAVRLRCSHLVALLTDLPIRLALEVERSLQRLDVGALLDDVLESTDPERTTRPEVTRILSLIAQVGWDHLATPEEKAVFLGVSDRQI